MKLRADPSHSMPRQRATQIYSSQDPAGFYKLNLSRLLSAQLLCRLTVPSLKYLSSPAAVRPPTYHFSLPSTSLKPSLEESLPRLPLSWIYLRCVAAVGEEEGSPGEVESGEVGCARGECREVSVAVAAPLVVDVVVIVRGEECDTAADAVLACAACEEVT